MTRKQLGWCTNMQQLKRHRWCMNMWQYGRFISWCTRCMNMQQLRRHRWCTNMWWHGRLMHCKIWQSIVIRVHWCTHRNLTGNITSLLCFIFIIRPILTGVAIGYVRVPDDIPLKMIGGVMNSCWFSLCLCQKDTSTHSSHCHHLSFPQFYKAQPI